MTEGSAIPLLSMTLVVPLCIYQSEDNGLRIPRSDDVPENAFGDDCEVLDIGAIGDIERRFKGTSLLEPESESQSGRLDGKERPKTSDGDKDEMED